MIVNHISTVMEGSYAFGTQLTPGYRSIIPYVDVPILVVVQRSSTLKQIYFAFICSINIWLRPTGRTPYGLVKIGKNTFLKAKNTRSSECPWNFFSFIMGGMHIEVLESCDFHFENLFLICT